MKANLYKLLLASIAVICFGALASSPAFADPTSLTITLATGNAGLAATGPGPYAQVTFSFNSTTNNIDVSVSGLNGYQFFGSGAGSGMFGFNSTNSGLTLSNCVSTQGCSQQAGGSHMDGFGTFQYQLGGGAGLGNSVTGFTFTISQSGGFNSATWISQLGLTNNSTGFSIAIHAGLPNCTVAGGACTGFAANGALTPTPEPSSLTMLGTGLLGLGGLVRRRK